MFERITYTIDTCKLMHMLTVIIDLFYMQISMSKDAEPEDLKSEHLGGKGGGVPHYARDDQSTEV
jgi:hypothetical protein